MKREELLFAILAPLIALIFVACGGGGGGGGGSSSSAPSSDVYAYPLGSYPKSTGSPSPSTSTSSSSSSPSASSPASITGRAIDGYIRGAKVCLDTNYNMICDSGEPSSMTGSGGVYTLNVTQAQLNSYPIVVETIANSSYDEGRGVYFTKTLRMSAPAGVTTITPITTMVQKRIKDGNSTKAQAETYVANLIGIPTNKLYSDYIAGNDSGLTNKAESIAGFIQDYNGTIGTQTLEQKVQDGWSKLYYNNTNANFRVVSTSPSNGFAGASISTDINVTFSKELNTSSISYHTLRDMNGTTIDTNSSTATPYILNIKPTSYLTPARGYTLSLNPYISSSSGNLLGQEYNISFTTGGIVPAVIGSNPVHNQTNVGPYSWLDINFSTDMNVSTLNSSTITLNNGKSCKDVVYISNTKTARCYPYDGNVTNALGNNITYILTVNTGVKSISGEALPSNYQATFTTSKANPLPRLKTGQTDSNATYDDGWYSSVLGISRSFERNVTSGIVRDLATGLMWQDDNESNANMMSWQNAMDYCDMNLTLGGYSDWRLPTVNELISIANSGHYGSGPKTFSVFDTDFTFDNKYWSSTDANVISTIYRWYFDLNSTFFHSTDYGDTYYAKCVRGENSEVRQFLGDQNGSIVLDSTSGLMWQNSYMGTGLDWYQALQFCENNVTLGGYSDWRLPNINELGSLVDRSVKESATYFPFQSTTSYNDMYWSSTTNPNNPSGALGILFNYGTKEWDVRTMNGYVRCVRGGW